MPYGLRIFCGCCGCAIRAVGTAREAVRGGDSTWTRYCDIKICLEAFFYRRSLLYCCTLE